MVSTRIVRSSRGIAVLALLCLFVLVGTLAPGRASAAPKTPAPSIGSLTQELDHLARQAGSLTEQFNATQALIATQRRALATARSEQARARAGYADARRRFLPMLVAQYESGGFDSVGAMLTSDDPDAYLSSLATQNMVSRYWADTLEQLTEARRTAARAEFRAEELLQAARDARDTLAEKRHEIRDRTAKYHTLLSALTSAQREAYASWGAPTQAEITAALRTRAPSKGAERAVQFAVAQIGKPYIWAATGPDSFDCSGLTMAAWARGGVTLPHFAAAQYRMGRHVSWNQLAPGDLVFLYSDLSHVEIYIGAGIAISAPQEGEDVKFVRVADFRNVFAGATRLG